MATHNQPAYGPGASGAGWLERLRNHLPPDMDAPFLALVFVVPIFAALLMARGPHARIEAIVRAGFGTSNFRPATIAAWLNFYVLSLTFKDAERLLRVYQGRLRSNLIHNLRSLVDDPAAVATRLAGLIDGLYLQQGLSAIPADGQAATAHVLRCFALELKATP